MSQGGSNVLFHLLFKTPWGLVWVGLTHGLVLMRSDAACRLILKLHDETGNLVAHCLLPDKFIVKANGHDNSNDTGVYEPRVHTESRQQNLWSGFPVPNPPSVPILECRIPELPTNVHPVPVNHHPHFSLNYPTSVLHRLAPAEGPMSGGQTIFLSGINLPQPSQQVVYARFGNVVVTTV